MDIRKLQYFVNVAETLNFSRAAEILYVAQSSLSQQISKLEEEVGGCLLIRDSRRVCLTEAGKILYADAKEILCKIDEALIHVQSCLRNSADDLYLSIGLDSSQPMIMDYIFRFRQIHPEVKISLQEVKTESFENMIFNHEIDVCFAFVFNEKWCQTNAKTIMDTDMVVAIHKDAIGEAKDFSAIQEIKNLPYITVGKSERVFGGLLEILHGIHLFPQIHAVNSTLEMLMQVEAGIGYTILPRNVIENFGSDNIKLIEFPDNKGKISLVLAWDRVCENRAVEMFVNI